MFRRARLSVKPNVRPGIGARGSTAPNLQRGKESPRPPEPAAASAPKPAEPRDVPLVDTGGAEPQEKAPRGSTGEKIDGENDVEESSKSSPTASQRRKRVSSTSSLDKPSVSVPSESHPLCTVNQETLQPSPIPTKEKQPCSDRYRIYKAQKLREMLKEELRKEKKQWKNKYAINESQQPPDRSKMTMRDFIYYLPNNNPMTSSLEQEKKTEKSLTPVQTREQESKSTPDAEENEEMEEETDDGPLLVPRVKVAEDGSIILDEESLTVEVLRTKGPCVVEENDPIFERGSTTTYSSFRKNYYSKPWSNKETDMFFLAISMVGTDFSMIGQLFPHRARIEIKNKFKREEKTNGWRIDKAFQEKRPFDFDFFAHLLQKVLAEEEKRKQKSVKNQNPKEKKPSKPRKKVKVKKIVSEGVNDGLDGSVSTKISDTEGLLKDTQTAEEEQSPLTLSEQDSGQIALESDLNQKKRRRRNQDDAEEQEVKNHLGNATFQAGPSKGEKHKNKRESLRPEVNEGECDREQQLSCLQNTDDIVDISSSEKVEKRTDPIVASSNQQDAVLVSTESSESVTSHLPSSEVGTKALSEVNDAESSCTGERNVDLKNKSLETDQTGNVKPTVRGRLQRPKPNLSRAVGKKPVSSQGKTDSKNKSSHPETSVEKNHVEKDQMNTFDSLGKENSEKESVEAEAVSDLSEKVCLQEDNQPKASRPARLTRGRLQRPKPSVGKVAERKEIPASQEEIGASEEKNENESCIDRAAHEQTEDQPCKNFDCGDIASQPEKKDTFQNVQADEPKGLKECRSIQEDNEANICKQAPIIRTRFQKPNIGSGTGRREIFSREEVPEKVLASGEMQSDLGEMARPETLPREKVPVEASTTKEMLTNLKETGRHVPLREKISEMIDTTMEMETGLRETGKEISPGECISDVIDVLEEIETDFEETGEREIPPWEKAPEEVKTVSEVEKGLKKTEREVSPRKKITETIAASEEREADFEETGKRQISAWEKAPEEVKTVGEVEKGLKKTEKDVSPRKKIPEMIASSAEGEADFDETGKREISPQKEAPEEVNTVGEVEKGLKKTEREVFPRKKIPEMIAASEETEADFEETGEREISPQEEIPAEVKTVGKVEKGLKKTEREVSPRKKIPEMIAAPEEREADFEETGEREISPWKKAPEEVKTVGEGEKGLKKTEKDVSPRKKIPEVIVPSETIASSEEGEADFEEAGSGEISPWEKVPEEVKSVGEVEKDLKKIEREVSPRKKIPEVSVPSEEREADFEETRREISSWKKVPEEVEKDLKKTEGEVSLREKIPEMIVDSEEREADFEETGEREISPWEKAPEKVKTVVEVEKDLKKTEREISPRRKIPLMIATSEKREADFKETGRREISPWEKAPEEVKTVVEVEKDLKKTEREISPRRKIPLMIATSEKREADFKETGRREISPWEKAPEEVKTVGEMETDLEETGREISPRQSIPEMITAFEEREADFEKSGRREITPQEKAPEEAKTIGEMETDLEETGREIFPRQSIPEMIAASEEREADFEETGRREIPPSEKAPEEVKTISEVEVDLEETGRDISPREKVVKMVSTIREREIDLKETGKGNVFVMDKVSGKMTVIEEMEADLKDTGREISLRERGSGEISAIEETVADLRNTGKVDTAPRKNEPEETDTSRQTEINLIQNSSGDCSCMPLPDVQSISSDMQSVVRTSVEEKRSSEEEASSQLSHSEASLQTSDLGKIEDQGMQFPDVPEQRSNTNLSKSLPQEQKPFEVKIVPFVRSRFKKPKPNLARAALKRETTEAEKYVPGKKLEMDKMETVVVQQNTEQTNNCPSQDNVASLMTSREKDESGHKEEKAVILPCVQTEKSLSRSHSCEPEEEPQSTQAQEDDLVASTGTYNTNTLQQEMKESGIQTSQPIRRRLQRPKPNIRKIEQRQIVEKSEAKDIIKEERPVLQKDETKKSPAVPNSQIGTEIEVVSSKVSECRINEDQSHVVLVENLHVNKINVLDEKIREEHKTYAPSPAQLGRRHFQRAKPNLRRAHSKRKESGTEKGMADQSEARKLEDNLLQQEESDIQLLLKKKTELLASLEISARKDCTGPTEAVLAKKDAESEEPGPSGNVGKETLGNNSVSSVIEEQYLNKSTSCPQLSKESYYSKIALDRRMAISSASECEINHTERRIRQKNKPNVTKGRGSKRNRAKSSKKEPRASKAVLVTLRASQEEEDDDEDFASDYEEESYHLAPEEVNKAPVFVPLGLRSPEPVATQIEETMEELEITVNVPDTTCIATVEHQLSNSDVSTQEMKQEEGLNALPLEMTTDEHTQDEIGTNDGSTEAAIALLTMGDLVLQSEVSTEQGDGIVVLPDIYSKDNSHIPSSPDNIKHNIIHESQELSSAVISISPASLEEDSIVLEEQSIREEIGLMEKVKENAPLTRNTASRVTSNLRIRNRFPKPKPNLKRILGTKRLSARQEVPSLSVTKGEEVEIQRETEENSVQETELENKKFGSVITAESKEQSKLACAQVIGGTSISQEANITGRSEAQEEGSQEVQRLSVAPVVSSETGPHTLGPDRGLGESPIKEPLRKHSSGDSVLTLHEPECTPTSIPEVQQENVISPQDLPVNLVANVQQDGEDEQTFILTLVEIPADAVEEFTNTTAQLMPNPLLPAPILVKSRNTEERSDVSMSFPVTSIGQDATCLSNFGRDDSEKPLANLDLISRKRAHCRLEESDCVPPAKISSLTSRDDCQEYTSEVCSEELVNVFEETGESSKRRNIFPTSGSTYATPEPQKEQLEPALQSTETVSLDKIVDSHEERNTTQLPQDGMVVSDKEERTGAASKSHQMDSKTSSSKTPLSRPGRRPLGFLSLICSKNSLESDEPTQVHSKKRLKPLIPVSRKNLKRPNPPNESQKKIQESSDQLPSSSLVVNTQSENTDSLAAQELLQYSSCPCPPHQAPASLTGRRSGVELGSYS
ncbi:transcription factor TFIIIB component B'' homolog isoform X3 [Elephas maximus indicus]|uniref:transcription factor TFIIIB component B'' homolog isoform X3 n=1 Tax=Elephas maximus indicus TaxID=99487 RepID=UPI0021171A7B|nr:transcription factor TFIIIB component B'' homolog isoform X3 [Elephas maximus indicus]